MQNVGVALPLQARVFDKIIPIKNKKIKNKKNFQKFFEKSEFGHKKS